MKFKFGNFGQISEGEVELKDLTIICGPNGTGKTYISYAIHSFLRNFEQLARISIGTDYRKSLADSGRVEINLDLGRASVSRILEVASSKFLGEVNDYFSVDSDFFSESGFEVLLSEDIKSEKNISFTFSEAGLKGLKRAKSNKLLVTGPASAPSLPSHFLSMIVGQWAARAIVGKSVPTPFAITSERTGISLFWKDLDVSRNQLFERMFESGKKEVEIMDIFLSRSSRYALPIKENIDAVRRFEDNSKKKSFLVNSEEGLRILGLLERLVGGEYSHDGKSLNYNFKIKGVRKRRSIPIYVASSSVKSVFLLHMYARHLAQHGDILIIDEPELNLHPDNQRAMAGILVALVNLGVKVLVTTHSDFFVREISSRISLAAKGNRSDVMGKYGLIDEDLIDASRVSAFSTAGRKIVQVSVDKDGIDMETLTNAIGASNEFYEDALFL